MNPDKHARPGWHPERLSPPAAPTHPLDRRESIQDGQIELSPEWETRAAISAILTITAGDGSFRAQLFEILDVIVNISWLGAARQGAIFVANSRDELVLTVHHSFSPQLERICAKVAFGHCLCGRVAATKQTIFKDCVDHQHENRFEGMKPHGHYILPLLDRDKVIGVMVLYLEHGHQPHPEETPFIEMLGHTVSGFIINRNLRLRAEVSDTRMQRAQQDMMQKLVTAAEYRDNETGAHIQRISRYSVILGHAIGLDVEQLSLLEMAAPMHDIGKVGVPDKILLKPGPLDSDELRQMREHAQIGGDLLEGDHPLMRASRDIALTHHERWDGKGYPNGLAGSDIPLFGRICAIVDVFDALTSERPYKRAWSVNDAIGHITDNAGRHFDPVLVEAFVSSLPEILVTRACFDGSDSTADEELLSPGRRGSHDRTEIVCWDDSLSVGVPVLDRQHRYLVDLINRVHDALQRSNTKEITEALPEMLTYSKVHFREEEDRMLQAAYPELEAHKKLHESFSRRTAELLDELEVTPLAACFETSTYLHEWWLQHIQGADQAYADYLRSKGD